MKNYFEDFDFSGFWENNPNSLNDYVGPILTDEMIQKAEEKIGGKLPESYLWLMRKQNGGKVSSAHAWFPHPNQEEFDKWAGAHITNLYGISEKMYALLGMFNFQFWREEWGYPDDGIVICDTISGGHDAVIFDYSRCDSHGEPSIAHYDADDKKSLWLAPNFEAFIRGLVPPPELSEDDE